MDPTDKKTIEELKRIEELRKRGELKILSPEESKERFRALEKEIDEGNKLVEEVRKRLPKPGP